MISKKVNEMKRKTENKFNKNKNKLCDRIINESNINLNENLENFMVAGSQEVSNDYLKTNKNQDNQASRKYQENIFHSEHASQEMANNLIQSKLVNETINKSSIQPISNSKLINYENTQTIDYMIEEAQQEQQKRQYENEESSDQKFLTNIICSNENQTDGSELNEHQQFFSIPIQKKRGRKPKLSKNQFLIIFL